MRVKAHALARTTPDYLWLPSPWGAGLRREAGVPAGLSVVCALLVTFGLALWLLPFLSPPLVCREKVPMTSWGVPV